MNPYSMDLRGRVPENCDAGMRTPAVAAKHKVGPRPARERLRRAEQLANITDRHRHRPRLRAMAPARR